MSNMRDKILDNHKIKEEQQYYYLIEKVRNNETKQRATISLTYFISNANKYKCLQKWFSILLVILPAIATFSSVFVAKYGCFVYIVSALTALTTILSGISSARKFTDKQNLYRDYAENIKRILTEYACSCGDYKNLSDSDKDEHLCLQIEKIIQESYKRLGEIEKEIEKKMQSSN